MFDIMVQINTVLQMKGSKEENNGISLEMRRI